MAGDPPHVRRFCLPVPLPRHATCCRWGLAGCGVTQPVVAPPRQARHSPLAISPGRAAPKETPMPPFRGFGAAVTPWFPGWFPPPAPLPSLVVGRAGLGLQGAPSVPPVWASQDPLRHPGATKWRVIPHGHLRCSAAPTIAHPTTFGVPMGMANWFSPGHLYPFLFCLFLPCERMAPQRVWVIPPRCTTASQLLTERLHSLLVSSPHPLGLGDKRQARLERLRVGCSSHGLRSAQFSVNSFQSTLVGLSW
ncbi:hypothetical protein M569_17238, partial [Genlisea aurea]